MKAFFNQQKAWSMLFTQDLYAAEAADGGYYEKNGIINSGR